MSNEIPIELQNLDIPGVDDFKEAEPGIYYCWQEETKNKEKLDNDVLLVRVHSGRWVFTNNILSPKTATIATYNGDFDTFEEALQDYKNLLNEPKS